MKQVVFAVFLLAMASLTGCLNEEDSSDTTEDNTDTKDDGLINPVGQTGYTPPDKANITVHSHDDYNYWVAKDGNRITTSCMNLYEINFVIYDSDDRIIYLGNSQYDYGVSHCGNAYYTFDVTLGPEPVKVGFTSGIDDHHHTTGDWIITF